MVSGNIQYLSETRLIERLCLLEDGINKANLEKQAGSASSLLSGAASSLAFWGKEHVNTSSPSSIISSLADLLIPGVLFKIHPGFGILAAIAEALGFSPTNLIKKILSFLSGKLDKNELPTLQDINELGKDVISSDAGALNASGFTQPLGYLEKLSEEGLFHHLKLADSLPTMPFFGGKGNESVLSRIFGNLMRSPRGVSKAKWLIGGFALWIIKTVLLGAGLIAGAEGISKLFKGKPATSEGTAVDHKTPETHPEEVKPSGAPMEINLTPTGKGTDNHTNDKTSLWFVPIVGGSVENTLTQWAGYVYQELQNPGINFSSLPTFQRTVQEMRANYSPGTGAMQVPSKFKSIKQVVDQFAPEAFRKIKGL